MEPEGINFEELKLSDRLAVERTIMGADRTLLAWVRTSLSLIGFGFTIFKVLSQFEKTGGTKFVRDQTPRNIGIFMMLVGILPLALAMYQYRQSVERLGGKHNVYVNPGMVAAGAILLLGVALLIVTALNLQVL
jgi:putative membrane protein